MSSATPIVSIIIPIYNVEKEIDRCMQSVLAQTYPNLEIILVDDGSPDRCPQICDEYQKKDKRIKVIHKENGGLSSARNSGLDIATGEYIAFVDSDDWIEKDFIEVLLNNIQREEADISIIGYTMVWEDGSERHYGNESDYEVYNQEQAIREILIQRKFQCMVCSKMYKKSIFDSIRFPVGKPYEDVAITIPSFLKVKKIVYTGKRKYYYWQREGSIVNSEFNKDKLYLLQSCEDILAFSRKNNGKYDLEAHTFYLRALLLLFFNLYASKKIPNEILQQFKCRLRKEKKYIIRNPYLESRKKLVFYLIILNFPSKILYKLWKNHTKG